MGCGNCGTGASGKPSGCKSNGGCSTGGCNRMNVFDWLNALPLHDSAKPYPIIEVSFNKGSRKEFYRNNTHLVLEKGQMITVEGVSGFDVGMVSLTGELVKLQMKKYGAKEDPQMKRVLRLASDEDLDHYYKQKDREQEIMVGSRAIAKQLKLEMKICEVEVQADGKKGTFFYTADGRVDFRELIKVYATEFRFKVEMRQIGARQESGKVGGIGSCGRELCCSTWLTDFKSVNTNAARYQNLSINQTKLSGQCGRLKCCLNYELDTYMDALRVFPDHAETLQTTQGEAFLLKKDIFRNLMWYGYRGTSKQYPLTIVRVKEILKLNKEGKKPDELQPVELETNTNKAGVKVEMGFVNDVGQITLKTLEKNSRRKSSGNKPQHSSDQPKSRQQARPQSQKPQQPSNPNQQPKQNQPSQRPAQPQQKQGQQGGQQRNQKPNPNQQRNNNNNRNQQPQPPAK
ncbi:MAG TPA: regulatory iron-sulfur-containing complex subunit RicT [Flavipsychrobacter sp.]|nr:regulatory iron-sulfur-containing complex subunit RicT [Flavipsychrobacter sp.]